MSLFCQLLNHTPVSDTQINQGFAFSRCRRCGRDMIRSVEGRPATEWKTVPSGFRVVREPPADQTAPSGKGMQPGGGRHRMPPGDALRIGGALLYWRLCDVLTEWQPRREIVRRLPMG
jgi:hypothetical protein